MSGKACKYFKGLAAASKLRHKQRLLAQHCRASLQQQVPTHRDPFLHASTGLVSLRHQHSRAGSEQHTCTMKARNANKTVAMQLERSRPPLNVYSALVLSDKITHSHTSFTFLAVPKS